MEGSSAGRGGFKLTQALSVLAMGLGIGWLVGLSLSPVVGSVIASLLGVGGGLVVGWRSTKGGTGGGIDARPAALLILGVAVAATAGLFARTVGPLAAVTVPAPAASGVAAARPPVGLFGASADECAELRAAWGRGQPESFVRRFRTSSIPRAGELVSRVSDPQTLALIMEVLCAPR